MLVSSFIFIQIPGKKELKTPTLSAGGSYSQGPQYIVCAGQRKGSRFTPFERACAKKIRQKAPFFIVLPVAPNGYFVV